MDATTIDLARGEFVVLAMEGDRSGTDWLYTIGLDVLAAHPELVMLDSGEDHADLLASLAAAVCSGVRFQPGSTKILENGRTLTVTEFEPGTSVPDPFEFGRLALARLGHAWPGAVVVTVEEPTVLRDTADRCRVLRSGVRIS